MKICFLKLGTMVAASTRIRVDYVAKYIDNVTASNKIEHLSGCDAVIFQKRYKKEDIEFARQLKKANKIIIFDLTDPVWDSNYTAVHFPITNDKEKYFNEMLELADCVTFCSSRLEEMFNKVYYNKNTMIIPDRLDLSLHTITKKHKHKKEYLIGWFGNKFNVDIVNLARDDLEKLYKDINFQLVIIRDKDGTILKPFNFETLYKTWNLYTINNDILDFDITINPHLNNSYKSNNKTIKSLALGVPCVEDDFYNQCRYLLSNLNYRKKEAKKGRQMVIQNYDSRISALELETLIMNLKDKVA